MDINDALRFTDRREIPAYNLPEVAHYLNMPQATVRAWCVGSTWQQKDGRVRKFKPVIQLPSKKSNLLSFLNLVEVHILRSLRVHHNVQLLKIRQALDYVKRESGLKRPLIQQEFKTDSLSLFIERFGKLIDAGAEGQIVMRKVMEAHLERIQWEEREVVALFPFTRNDLEGPRTVLIDPRYSFGRPILQKCRISTAIIAERYKAGDSVEALTRDYGCENEEIQEAIRCELKLAAAA